MARKRSASSAPAKRRDANVKYLPDSELDLVDIPESTDEELKARAFVAWPPQDWLREAPHRHSHLAARSGPAPPSGRQAKQTLPDLHPRVAGTRRQQIRRVKFSVAEAILGGGAFG